MVYRSGILGWAKSGRQLESFVQYPDIDIPLISSLQLYEKMGSSAANVVDIRPPGHFENGRIKGSINMDLEQLHNSFINLSKEKPMVLVDHKGKLTLTTGRYLVSKGFSNLSRLDGGVNAWVKNQLPLEK